MKSEREKKKTKKGYHRRTRTMTGRNMCDTRRRIFDNRTYTADDPVRCVSVQSNLRDGNRPPPPPPPPLFDRWVSAFNNNSKSLPSTYKYVLYICMNLMYKTNYVCTWIDDLVEAARVIVGSSRTMSSTIISDDGPDELRIFNACFVHIFCCCYYWAIRCCINLRTLSHRTSRDSSLLFIKTYWYLFIHTCMLSVRKLPVTVHWCTFSNTKFCCFLCIIILYFILYTFLMFKFHRNDAHAVSLLNYHKIIIICMKGCILLM